MRIPGTTYVQGRNSYSDPDGKHYGIAIHNTSNDASATNEASYAARRTDGVSAHFYVDNTRVVQSLDTNARAGHAGSANGNGNAIAVEITGTNGKSRTWWENNVAWSELGRVLGYLIAKDPDYADFQVRRASVAEMRSTPKVKALYSHDDMRRAWGGTTHTDPGEAFPWDRLIAAIKTGIKTAGGTTNPTTPATGSASTSWTEKLVKSLPTLKAGAEGAPVTRVQALANAAGQKIAEDGDFGPKTTAAVKAEQTQAGITADGIVGQDTWSVLLGVR